MVLRVALGGQQHESRRVVAAFRQPPLGRLQQGFLVGLARPHACHLHQPSGHFGVVALGPFDHDFAKAVGGSGVHL